MKLHEFLLARIADDEENAWHARWGQGGARNAAPVARLEPARVFAECEAKKRTVNQYLFHADMEEAENDNSAGWAAQGLYEAMLYAAEVYRSHADWRPTWDEYVPAKVTR